MSHEGRLADSGARVPLGVSCELSLRPRLHPYGISKFCVYFSKFPPDRDWDNHRITEAESVPALEAHVAVFPGLDAWSGSMLDHMFVAGFPLGPVRSPAPPMRAFRFVFPIPISKVCHSLVTRKTV